VFLPAAADLAPLAAEAWREALAAAIAEGGRLVSLYGRADGAEVLLTAIVDDPTGAPRVLRARVDPEVGYHTLSVDHPTFHLFEREVHEQLGVHVRGHPWKKPVRWEGGPGQVAMMDHPWYTIEGKDVHEVAVGPIHAGVIEPGSFRFLCHGERVLHLEIHLGYQHRGAEARLRATDPRRAGPLIETLAGDTSVGHTWAYAAAVEALAGHDAESADPSRALLLELERVGLHLKTLSGLAADIGFLQGATAYGRLRTTVINTTMRLCGSRFGRSAVRPGGPTFALDTAGRDAVEAALGQLDADLPTVDDRFLSDRTVRHRLRDVGTVPRALAEELGMVGVAARASGVPVDQRAGAGGVWAALPVRPAVETSGDCWARARVRIHEMRASVRWMRALLEGRPTWERAPVALGELAPSRLVVSRVEGARGEVVHCVETDARGGLLHYKVTDPSFRNWTGLAMAVRGNEVSDFPICNKSFDLSYCGHDL
jgi:Ni,Fe-hydrogenase III large subunit